MTENTKYAFTSETLDIGKGVILKRIVALKDFGHVKKGDLGGWLASKRNLSPLGNSWVYDEAKVFGNAKVLGNAEVQGHARVYGHAKVYGDARISRDAQVWGHARVYEVARVWGRARVWGNSRIYGHAHVSEHATVSGNARVYEYATITDRSAVSGDANVSGNVQFIGEVHLFGDAKVVSDTDYIVFKNNWSSGRYFTWTKSNDMWKVGCFYGTGEELIEKAYEESEESGRKYELYVNLVKELQK